MATTPTLTNFTVAPRVFIKDASFQLIDPSSNNTNLAAVFTFTSSNTNVADISGRIVRIINSGQTTITATQSATTGYTTGQITAVFSVNVAAPSIGPLTITPTPVEFKIGSFNLQDPSSNSSGSFSFESLTTDIITIFNRTVTLKRVGRAQIKATQAATGNYTSGYVIATFDVLSSIVIPGTQNRLDLSWNIPTENGATIKNYFFYTEERRATISPAPTVSTIMESISATNPSYYSYVMPVPYSTQVLSATVGAPTGIDVNSANTSFNITTLPQYTNKNFFDIGYYGEIEVNWVYHNDKPIVELDPNNIAFASTTMTLSIFKEASTLLGDNRIDLILNTSRTYDSSANCYGPMPQNNNKTMTDIFTIMFPGSTAAMRDLKYLKPSDVISGRVTISSNTYSPAAAPNTLKEYSIIIKSIRIAPFRFPISRDFTSLGFGLGTVNGFSVSTFNALSSPSSSDVSGVLYHMPKMTRPLTNYNKASWTFSWKYEANLSKLITDLSYLPVSNGLITNLDISFNMRIRGYSRPYATTSSSILDSSYNSTSVPFFLSNVSNTQYNTRQLFDISFNDTANYNKIFTAAATDASFQTFDVSGSTGFSPFTNGLDYSHSQFVFLFQMTILDPSYNAYFRTINTEANSFKVKMLSQTFTPYQEYRFADPDPTLASSNSLTTFTNTLYNLVDYYTPIKPFYTFFDLSNGVFYSYRISSHNIVGTSAFSDLLTRRCGSIPNTILNRVNSLGADTLSIESERTSNRVNIYWEKPSFTGYEIQYFSIQMAIDVSGRWVNSVEYTSDLSTNLIRFNMFDDTIVNVTDQTKTEYDETISVYTYNTLASQQNFNTSIGLNTPLTGPLLNGYKYYFRLASVNELGRSAYSSILSGIPFARPVNSPIQFIGDQTIGNQIAILTWKIPQDDAGSPILNYIIDYEEVTTQAGRTIYTNKTRYIQDAIENGFYQQANRNYPFDDFRKVYAGYKKFSALTANQQTDLMTLRSEISKYIILPRPIILNDPDKFLNSQTTDVTKNIVLSYTNRSFTYKSNLLTQNVFDLSNIQLKWYYTQDTTGGGELWTNGVSASFQLSIRGDLEHNSSDRSRDISGIFDISGTYVIDVSKMSRPADTVYNYINYLTGNVIPNGTIISNIPAKYVKFESLSPPTLYRIDHNNNKGYYLKMEYTISNISRSDYRFIFYSGQVGINGVAPVRTFAGLNTQFTVTLKNNIYSPFVNGKKYLFTITPFNINDFFPDPSKENDNYGNGISQTARTMGTAFSDPITDMSYSLISTSQGGKVLLQWKYSSKPSYYINIQIPQDYAKEDVFPQEYPLLLQSDGTSRSILTPNLDPSNGIVSYIIPSDLQSDINESNAQKYLKSGRGYTITVSPVQSFINSQGEIQNIPAPARDMFPDNTYIIPFRTPLRPLELSAQGYNGYVGLKWILPNFNNDPNFYNTDSISTYYRYKYFTLERRNISAAEPVWIDVSNEISIPTPGNGGVSGYQAQYIVNGLVNEQPHQFRIRTVIMNEYNGQRTFSDYTYMSNINNIPVPDNSGVTVTPSIYPFKPSTPLLRFADRTGTASGVYNGLIFTFDYPTYNGNADYYECDIHYTPVDSFGAVWYGIFDVTNGIADISYNISVNSGLFTTNGKLRTLSAAIGSNQNITVVCRNTVLSYGIKIRMYPRINGLNGNYPSGDSLYSEFSNVDYIDI